MNCLNLSLSIAFDQLSVTEISNIKIVRILDLKTFIELKYMCKYSLKIGKRGQRITCLKNKGIV